ncbi:MAG: SRPBCC family protein [Pseudomonadales bacterium]
MAQTTIEESFSRENKPDILARTPERAQLDKTRYTSSEFLEREWDSVWSRAWLFAGLLSDLAENGDYFVYEVGRESIVVLRDDKEQLRAFYNVCQHRGNRLLTNECGSLKRFTCPYHGWSYELSGELKEVPDAERFCPAIDPQERSLKPVLLEQWAGMIWLNLDPNADPLDEFLGQIKEQLEPYHFEKMVLSEHQTVSIDANWKTVRDNFLEQYHVDFIHPQHASFVDCCNSTNLLWPLGHSASKVEGFVTNSRYPIPETTPPHLVPALQGLGLDPAEFDGRINEIRNTVQLRKRELGADFEVDFSGLTDDQLSDVWQFDLFPNTFMTIQAEELWIFGPRPHASDANRCYFDKLTLQLPIEAGCNKQGISLAPGLTVSREDERPEHDVFTSADVVSGRKSLTITIDQDIEYLPDMQSGLHSRGFDCAVLNEDEVRLQHFHDWLDHWMNQ